MLARLILVGSLLGPAVASAKGSHVHFGGGSGSFGGFHRGHVGGTRLESRTVAPVETWDMPLDQVPDGDQREASASLRADRGAVRPARR